jgi:hypothetical protein
MKFNFRKISAIAASALMAGMSMGFAAAANYPAPFVSGGVASVAVVYGTGTGVSSLDLVQANNIQDSLAEYVDAEDVVVEGGESFALDKSSDHFNFNEALNGVYTDLGADEMDFLADGTYDDGSIDEDYTQTITPSSKALSLFAESDYNDKEPTIGFLFENGDNILDYDLEFDNAIVLTAMNDTDFPLMGNTYYVITATDTTIEMLDSAQKTTVSEGETVTVGEKVVEIATGMVGSDATGDWVKFTVDGETTPKMYDHDYEELDDGSYIVANEVLYNSRDTGVSNVEFSLGAGKITMTSGDEIQLNEEDVDGLTATFDTDSFNIEWDSHDQSFLTAENALTMPLFESIRLVFGGMNFPADPEAITLTSGEQMNLEMGNYNLPLFFLDSAGVTGIGYLGEEDAHLVTKTVDLAWNYTGAPANTSDLSAGLDLMEHNRILVTSLETDLGDIQTMYYEVNTVDYDSSDIVVELDDLIGNDDISLDAIGDTQDVKDITVKLLGVNSTHAYLTFTGTGISYNTAVSDKGLEVTIPANISTATLPFASGVLLTFIEADKDGDLGEGMQFTATVKNTSDELLHVSAYNTTISDKEESSDVYVGYVKSDLATKVTSDKSGDENTFELEYYGEEVTADVMVVGGAATVSGGSATLGNILVKDSEVSSVATKNLIVVGGSCINSAAAKLLGSSTPMCGPSWTTATDIGAGQFLIKGYADSTITTGVALLVAGYDAEDTVKAATYLTNKVVDTSKAYKGTTTTETAVVIE